ncbi:hypothetical protein SODG_001579 [Sodalis praecaptivus]
MMTVTRGLCNWTSDFSITGSLVNAVAARRLGSGGTAVERKGGDKGKGQHHAPNIR